MDEVSTAATVFYPELRGKRAVVTGAGKGIGAETVDGLITQGCYIIAISRTQADLDKLKQKYDSTKIETILLDITHWNEVDNIFSKLEPFHYLINNAGIAICGPFLQVSEQDIDSVFGVNVKACLHVAQCAAKKMLENKIKGVVVNISSQASKRPIKDHTMYCCTKAALDMLTKMMSLELGPSEIRTVSVNPTVVMTDMGRKNWSEPSKSESMLSQIPLRRFAEVDEVVKPILFCLSDGAAMINGCDVNIDGGFVSA
ncbi:D-erythrulose reductase-like [Symsagittifera roscoffensis]|uniref:D-erythrulose reductase-like n=1 Tax=Symsagittifera roscoffensis TaxID=84072 RepID=UPI00307BFEA3